MHPLVLRLAAATLAAAIIPSAQAAGDAARGAQLFGACASCHSVAPDRNMTGPSLAGIAGRTAGSLSSFERYSPELIGSKLKWNDAALDAWLASPAQLVPGNRMSFPGVADARQRADLIAFLQVDSATQQRLLAQAGGANPAGGMGGMMGMGQQMADLKRVGAARQVQAINVCRDSYRVTTADGLTKVFWEANLRFKTDSSDKGPPAGKPVIMPAGMMGDRASVIFAAPEEVSPFIAHAC
jgi:cytochrome c